jgi:hypothetical protein
VFIYHQNVFDIKELVEFSPELPTISIKEFDKEILKADGYSNKVLLGFENEAKMLVLDLKSEILNERSEKKQEWSFRFPDGFTEIKSLFLFNKGKNVLIGFAERVYVLNHCMEVQKYHKIIDFISANFKGQFVYSLHMPSKQSKSYLIYSEKNIWVFNIRNNKITKLEAKHCISKIATSSVNNHPELVYNDWYGGVFLNQHELKLEIAGDFTLFQGNLIYLERKNSEKVFVYNFAHGKKYYSFNVMPFLVTDLISACPFKIFYKQDSVVYLHSVITGITHIIQSPFEEIYQVVFINPLLILAGKIRDVYGLVFIDFYRKNDKTYKTVLEECIKRFESQY